MLANEYSDTLAKSGQRSPVEGEVILFLSRGVDVYISIMRESNHLNANAALIFFESLFLIARYRVQTKSSRISAV